MRPKSCVDRKHKLKHTFHFLCHWNSKVLNFLLSKPPKKKKKFRMSSNREEPLTFASSSPITVSDQLDNNSYHTDPSSHIGSASNSFQNDTFLSESSASINLDVEFGFSRPEFRLCQLAGTVDFYERHVFVCYKNPSVWPPRIEAAEFDRLPRLLSAAVGARKPDMKREVCLFLRVLWCF